MNLKIQDVKVGDKFKQVKALGTYMFDNHTYIVESVDENESSILLSFKSEKNTPYELFEAKAYLSLDELNRCFERVKKFVWTDWKEFDKHSMYKTNRRITYVKITYGDKTFKGKATCHKDDWNDYDLDTGIEIAYERALKKKEKYLEELDKKMFNILKEGDKVKAINDEYRNCDFVPAGAVGVIKSFNPYCGVEVEWESNETWWIESYNVEVLSDVKKFEEGTRVRTINDEKRDLSYVYKNATGTIKKVGNTDLFVEWDYGCSVESRDGDNCWYIGKSNVEIIDEKPSNSNSNSNFILEKVSGDILTAPANYTLLHTIYAESKGNAVGLTKAIIDTFDIEEDLKDELNYLVEVADFYEDNDDLNGDIITYSYKNVVTLVSKRERHDTVSYDTIKRGMQKLKKHMENNNLHYLAMPCICCGREKLEWQVIEDIITKVFSDCKIPITIKVYIGY